MFDPYHKWLGIPPGHRPPNYYQLLGIAPDEQDPDVIEAAAVRQSAYVRNFQTSSHARACSQILNEIAQARLTLRDSAKRSAYDAHIKKASSAPEALPKNVISRREVATPPDVFRQVIVEPEVLGRAKPRSKRLGRRTRRTLLARLLNFSFITVAIVFVAAALLRSHFPSGWARLVSPSGGQVNGKGSDPGGKAGARKSPSEEHFERGMVLINKKEYEQARAEFSETIRFDPKFAEAYHRRGVCHRNTNEFDKAIADFTKAIELGRAGSCAERGDAYYHKGDGEKALADLEKGIQLDPKNHWACWVKSWVMASKGDYRAAIACLDQANGIAPSSDYWIARGQAFERMNDGHNAIASYCWAIRINPNSDTAYNHRAWQFVGCGMWGCAIADYDIAISIDPKIAWHHTGRGITFYKVGNYSESINCYNRAIQADPKYANAYYHRSWALRKVGDTARADTDRQKALSLDSSLARTDGMYP